jgi:hypothetical protein
MAYTLCRKIKIMTPDTKEQRRPRRRKQPITETITANFLAVKTGIICAVVFFIAGIIFGLKIGGGRDHESSRGDTASAPSEAAPSNGGIPAGRTVSGTDTIRNWSDYDRASDAERQRHYQGVADRANQSGMRYNVTPKDIKEGVEAFYSE